MKFMRYEIHEKIQFLTREFHIEFHEKNDIVFSSEINEIQCGIHESGIEFFLNLISHSKLHIYRVLFML